MKHFFFRVFVLLLLGLTGVLPKANAQKPSLYEASVDFPFQGGVMVTGSRLWRINKFMEAGFFVSGGSIEREFDLSVPGAPDAEAKTESLVLPFFGPRISFNFQFVGLSLAYGMYYAKTDMDVTNISGGPLTGETKGWGSGFYSPLLVLDFYDKRRNVAIGLGLGGFLGTSGPDLKASSASRSIKTDASPIDTLTLHVRFLWAANRRSAVKPDDDF